MRRNGRSTLLIGVALAILTFVVVLILGSGGGGGPKSTAGTQQATVVAAVDIPLGTVVTSDMVRNQQVIATARDSAAYADVSAVIGKTARRNITAGAQVVTGDFDASGALSVSVPKGLRAFAMSVDELTGVANILKAGDFVDVVITLDDNSIPTVVTQVGVPDWQIQSGYKPTTVKAPLLLQDIQVLGTLSATSGATSGSTGLTGAQRQATPPPSQNGPTITGQPKLIILAVSEQQAEALIYARTVGTLNLILRGSGDTATVTTDGVDLQAMFDTYGVVPPYVFKTLDVSIPRQQ